MYKHWHLGFSGGAQATPISPKMDLCNTFATATTTTTTTTTEASTQTTTIHTP